MDRESAVGESVLSKIHVHVDPQNMNLLEKRTFYILSSVKQTTSPGWMHETRDQGWCTGKTQRDRMGKEAGGGIRMGNTCKSMADSCQCMAKTTTIL